MKWDVPQALEAVCLKAMALRPEDRYPTARALAGDIEKWLADEPVSAWREPLRLWMGRWVRRHQARVAAVATGVVVALLAGGVGAWWWDWDRQRAEQRQAVETTLEKVREWQRQGRWQEAAARLEGEIARLGRGGPSDLRARLGRAQAELDLVKRLEEVRLKRATVVEGRFDRVGADKGYEEAFRKAGMVEVGRDAEEAAAWLRGAGVRDALVAALDDWASCVGERERRSWLLEVARRADPDPLWRDGVRDPAAWDDAAVLAQRVKGEQAAQQSPQLLAVLGMQLPEKEAVKLLRMAWERHPDDFWVNFALGNALREGKKPGEGARYYQAALALRPGTAVVHTLLGLALSDQGQMPEAIAEYQKAIEIDSKDAKAHNFLGLALFGQGKVAEAVAEYRKAIEHEPNHPVPRNNLGNALRAQRQVAEAIAEYRRALEIDPNYAQPHYNLGIALSDQGKVPEAIAEYRKAFEIDTKDADAHYNLGIVLSDQGKVAEAIDEYQQAIKIAPTYTNAHINAHVNLGLALRRQGKVEEAIAAYRRAIEIDPNHTNAHINLGAILSDQGQVAEAIEEYRKAIKIAPKSAAAHSNLGFALHVQGQVAEAIDEFKKAIEIDPQFAQAHRGLVLALLWQGQFPEALRAAQRCLDVHPIGHPMRPAASQLLRQCEQMQVLDPKLPAFLKGEARPTDAAEQVGLAILCVIKKRYAAAARFFADTFAAQPRLADTLQAGHRYKAACTAALAAAGEGEDAAQLDDKERTRLRQQARGWLRADLALWGKQTEGGSPQPRAAVQKNLRHWQGDPDLIGVRHPAAVANLPEAERAEWQKLWADVEALRKKAGAGGQP